MELLPILLDGETVGELHAQEEGLYVRFSAACRTEGGPFHLSAVGDCGALKLGVPLPEGRIQRLERRLPQREVLPLGTLRRGELQVCSGEDRYDDWQAEDTPEQLFRSAFLRDQLRQCRGVLTRQEAGVRFIALPYDRRRPFLLASLFCFASVRRIRGDPYAVFCFDRDENPTFRR